MRSREAVVEDDDSIATQLGAPGLIETVYGRGFRLGGN